MTAGENVTLQCLKPKHVIEPYMFVLLKKGTPTTTQLHSQGGKETDFSLRSVTVDDTGNYSCVYYQKGAPFRASEPSDHIEIRVTGKVFTMMRATLNIWHLEYIIGRLYPYKTLELAGGISLGNEKVRTRTMW